MSSAVSRRTLLAVPVALLAALPSGRVPNFTFKETAYVFHMPPREWFPYARGTPVSRVDTGAHDAAGVRMQARRGRLYDHPVAQASYGIDNLESFLLTQDSFYLDRARVQAQRLMDRASSFGGGWYIPYPFDFYLHRIRHEKMAAPWYSAMAQGQALSLFVRLFEATDDPWYRYAADAVFASFLRPAATAHPWVVRVDADQYLWLEEYPGLRPDMTLNGHIFAAWGLWDYWRLTADEQALGLLRGALTTLARYIGSFRAPGWRSRYCLAHPTVQDHKYHLIHINQLLTTYSLTGAVEFARYAEMLSTDYPPPTVSGNVQFSAGRFTGVAFDETGRITGRKAVTLAKPTTAPADRRIRILGQPGLWYHVTAGAFAGHYVQETPARAVLCGQYVTYEYVPPRRMAMRANMRYHGFAFAADGTVVRSTSVLPTEETAFDARATSIWNAREYLLAQTGPLADLWIPRSGLITECDALL